MGGEGLEDLRNVSNEDSQNTQTMTSSYLKLNLGLSNVLLTSTAVRNLLGFGDLVSDRLGAEVLERETLDSVDAQDRVGLDGSETTRHCDMVSCCASSINWESEHTEERLGASVLLDDLDQTRLELLNRRNVVGENTHLTRLGGDVDLDDILGLVDGLRAAISSCHCQLARMQRRAPPNSILPSGYSIEGRGGESYLVRQGQGELDLRKG